MLPSSPPQSSPWLRCGVESRLILSCSSLSFLFLPVPRINGHSKSERTARDSAMGYDSASVMSSELESSSFVDSDEDEDASR